MGRNNKYFFPSALSVATGDWSVDGPLGRCRGGAATGTGWQAGGSD